MTKKTLCLLVSAVVVLAILAGCLPSVTYRTDVRRVTIRTEPSGANVMYVNPKNEIEWMAMGITPIEDYEVDVISKLKSDLDEDEYPDLAKRIGKLEVAITKPGYETYRGVLDTNPNRTVEYVIELKAKQQGDGGE